MVISNWVEQGVRWSQYSPVYDVTTDKTFDVEIWWYNGGGVGSYHLGWAIPGGWTGAGCDYAGNPRVWGQDFSCNLNTFSHGSGATQEQTNAYNNALAANPASVSFRSIGDNMADISPAYCAAFTCALAIKSSEAVYFSSA